MMVLLAAFGGMALLLYGIRLSGEALQRATDARLRHLLTGLSRNRFMAVVSGVIVTGLLQSSSATTIMLIGFVSAGLMTFRQTLGVILGADIGTTFTVQLIAFRVTDYSPLLVGLGFTATFVARRRVPKDLGQALLGLGLVFLGLKLILDNAGALRSSPLAVDLLDAVAHSPAIGVIVGAVFSALVTSSAATLGLALAFAHQGLLSLDGAVAVVLGANIGTCATALTASVGATAEAKRVAVAHIAFQDAAGDGHHSRDGARGARQRNPQGDGTRLRRDPAFPDLHRRVSPRQADLRDAWREKDRRDAGAISLL